MLYDFVSHVTMSCDYSIFDADPALEKFDADLEFSVNIDTETQIADPICEKLDAELAASYYKDNVEKWLTLRASEKHSLKFSLDDVASAKLCILTGFLVNWDQVRDHYFEDLYHILDDFETDSLMGMYLIIGSMIVHMVNITEEQYEIFTKLIMPCLM